jgi:hypothetical protein
MLHTEVLEGLEDCLCPCEIGGYQGRLQDTSESKGHRKKKVEEKLYPSLFWLYLAAGYSHDLSFPI